jgi:hypothetical protein
MIVSQGCHLTFAATIIYVTMTRSDKSAKQASKSPRRTSTCVCDATALFICLERRRLDCSVVRLALGVVDALNLANKAIIALG